MTVAEVYEMTIEERKKITLEEYIQVAKEAVRWYLQGAPRKEREKYILTLERRGYIKDAYEEDIDPEEEKITGCPAVPDPTGFAYGISMLYPDFP